MATASGGYRPLVQVLTEAEFDVTPNTLPFRPDRLATTDVVVIANPNGADERASVAERATSAFTDSEIDAVEAWVRGGGGLLLVTDHYPTGVAARLLGGTIRCETVWWMDRRSRESVATARVRPRIRISRVLPRKRSSSRPSHHARIRRRGKDRRGLDDHRRIDGGPARKRVTVAPESYCRGLDTIQHTSRALETQRHRRRREISIRARRATRSHRPATVKVSRSCSAAAESSSSVKWVRWLTTRCPECRTASSRSTSSAG